MHTGLRFHSKGLGDVDSASKPRAGRWVTATSCIKEGSRKGHRGHGESSDSHCSPCTHRWSPEELPASPSAASSPIPRRERNQVSNEPIWTGWDAAQASAQKKKRKKKVHILWYKYFGLPPPPRQPTGSAQEAQQPSPELPGKRLIPTAPSVCCNKNPHTDLAAHMPPRHCHGGERLLAEWSQTFTPCKVLIPKESR